MPGATIMVYDNYNALAIGFGAAEKPKQAVLSLAVYPRRASLCFVWGRACPTRTACSWAAATRSASSACPTWRCSTIPESTR